MFVSPWMEPAPVQQRGLHDIALPELEALCDEEPEQALLRIFALEEDLTKVRQSETLRAVRERLTSLRNECHKRRSEHEAQRKAAAEHVLRLARAYRQAGWLDASRDLFGAAKLLDGELAFAHLAQWKADEEDG